VEKDNLEILLEDIRSKFDLVLEGHDVLHKEIIDTREELCEKINLVDFKVETLNKKIDSVERSLTQEIKAVATDLAAHRADTESHQKGYKVSDGK
jgi:sigma54-dependent transcription regulator